MAVNLSGCAHSVYRQGRPAGPAGSGGQSLCVEKCRQTMLDLELLYNFRERLLTSSRYQCQKSQRTAALAVMLDRCSEHQFCPRY